jgi:glutaconyl-CoA/methylmalonyl-CoA decarboxylase subunit delta
MGLIFIDFDLSAIDKPTIIFVLAVQIIVIVVLFLLYRFFTVSGPVLLRFLRKQKDVNEANDSVKSSPSKVNGDVNAAIAMALYLHFNEMHDEESNVITIQRISKTYSPWSSKIYNMRNFR